MSQQNAPPPVQAKTATRQESRSQPIRSEQQAGPPPKAKKSSFIATVVGAAVAVALGVAAYTQMGTSSPSDQISQSDLAKIEASWTAATQNGIALDQVEVKDRAAAIQSMNLPAEQQQQIETQVNEGKTDLVWFRVWDNYAEDGDVIALNSDGLRVEVPLTHNVAAVALPKPAGGVINIEGVYDGGGGITLGIYAGQSPVLVPPMAPGQKLGIPVR